MLSKRKMKLFVLDLCDKIYIRLARSWETKKFREKRRVEIFSKILLTKEQEQLIDSLYRENYGKKIPYTWHKYFTAFTGKFDSYYFPELLFIPEFENFMNGEHGYVQAFQDKNVLPVLQKAVGGGGIRVPETVFSNVNGLIRDGQCAIVSMGDIYKLEGEYFIKPTVDTGSGLGCQVINIRDGQDVISQRSWKEIIESKGENWVIQERVCCHSSISEIYAESVNTFRVMTYIWRDEICHAPVIMRIGQGGSNLDNAHAGGMFVAVDDDGTLHDTAFTEFKKEYKEHPDTHVRFDGHRVELFPKVLDAAHQIHAWIPQIGCINWDFTIDKEGNPILIEMNLRGGSIWLFQMAHGKGVFGEKTPEILRWMRLMKHTKKSMRYKYAYGKMDGERL